MVEYLWNYFCSDVCVILKNNESYDFWEGKKMITGLLLQKSRTLKTQIGEDTFMNK